MKFSTTIGACFILASQISYAAVSQSEAESNPSNAELNRTYAIEMLASGNLDQALAGIERTIIAKPTDIPARFFRAKILVLLGRGDEVKDELQFITTLKLAPQDLVEAEKLLAEIEAASRSFSGSVSVQMGVGFNDNANSYSKSGYRYGTRRLTTVYPEDKKHSDLITQGAVIFSGQNDLNSSKTLAVKYVAGKTISNGSDTHEKDMGVTLGNVGLRYTMKNEVYLETKAGVTRISRTNKVNGGDFATDIATNKYSFEIGKTLAKGARISYLYSNISDNHSRTDTADNQDSSSTQHDIRISAPISSSTLISASGYYKTTEADNRDYKDNYDKDVTGLAVNLYQFLAPGHLMTYGYSKTSSDYVSYSIPEDGGIRSDETSVVSIKYRLDAEKLISSATGWKLAFGVKRSETDSNLKSSQVESNSFDITLSKVFDL